MLDLGFRIIMSFQFNHVNIWPKMLKNHQHKGHLQENNSDTLPFLWGFLWGSLKPFLLSPSITPSLFHMLGCFFFATTKRQTKKQHTTAIETHNKSKTKYTRRFFVFSISSQHNNPIPSMGLVLFTLHEKPWIFMGFHVGKWSSIVPREFVLLVLDRRHEASGWKGW